METAVIKTSQLVEAQILGTPAIGNEFKFSDNQEISNNNILLYALQAYSATQLSKSPISQNTVVAAAGVPSIAVTFVDDTNTEVVQNIPMYDIIRSNNGGFYTLVKPLKVNLTKCYIKLVNTTSVNANEVVLFNFIYTKIK